MRHRLYLLAILLGLGLGLGSSAAAAPPDVNGPGKVLRAGNVRMKVTNWGVLGNPFTNLSSDPSGMWPDSSGVEYLSSIALAVGAVDPTSAPGTPRRRVSFGTEWSPPTSDPEDRLYRTWETAVNGHRLVNDDGDFDPLTGEPLIDEEFLDGRDNDGDGLIDEDFAAIGHETYTCVMRDGGPYAMSNDAGGVSVPLSLEVRQMSWDYALAGLGDFTATQYTIFNRSGHALDSVYVGFRVDMDAGPVTSPGFFSDDRDLPGYPSGEFIRMLDGADPQRQFPHAVVPGVSPDSALCPRVKVRVNGFSLADDDGDAGATPGVATFLLVGHTVDPLGTRAPTRVGFRAFRSFLAGTPFDFGGNPNNDSLRYIFMSGVENVDPVTGVVSAPPGAGPGDYVQWCSIGPFPTFPDGAEIQATVAFAVQQGSAASGFQYAADYAAYLAGSRTFQQLVTAHPPLANAHALQTTADGGYLFLSGPLAPDFHGRETSLRQPRGSTPVFAQDCRDDSPRIITDRDWTWFDFDCDYCTGVWDYATQVGLIHKDWIVDVSALDVDEGAAPPGTLRLLGIVPNPGAAVSRLAFELGAAARVRATVYDMMGRTVRTVTDRVFSAGRHDVTWDGADAEGRRVAPGVYLVRIRAGRTELGAKVVRVL